MKKALFNLFLATTVASCSNVGEGLPTFELSTLDGRVITEQDLAGKITVINVWATWCGNCLNELGELNQLVEKYKGDTAVVFLALSDETPEKLHAFLNRREFAYTQVPNGSELTNAIQTRLVKTYPQHIVLGRDLSISYEATGEIGGAVGVLSAEIERLR